MANSLLPQSAPRMHKGHRVNAIVNFVKSIVPFVVKCDTKYMK